MNTEAAYTFDLSSFVQAALTNYHRLGNLQAIEICVS